MNKVGSVSWCRLRAAWASVSGTMGSRSFGSHGEPGESPLKRLLREGCEYSEREVRDPELHWATTPYTRAPGDEPKPRVDPRDATVLLFPGQGAQYVGMGKDLLHIPAAKDLFEYSSEVVGWDVARLCTEGPEEELMRRTQTCVLVCSLAALERLRDERPDAVHRARQAAGFSLGEYAALTFAGALSLHDALRVVEVRAAAMEAAARARPGGMLTVWLAADAELGHALLRAREAARAAAAGADPEPFCEVANYLYPNCKVLAGSEEALRFVERAGRRFGVRRSARVRVAGAYHCAAMGAAVPALREALRLAEVGAPRLAVVSSADARPYRDAAHVRAQLARQPTRPVRWEQTLHAMFGREAGAAFPLTFALGPGGALRNTLRQVNAKAWDSSVQIDT